MLSIFIQNYLSLHSGNKAGDVMARLPEEFISQVKAANDIVDLFRAYADVQKRGRIYVCCCPFHSEKTPSCTIYPDNASFYCFGCHVGGDVIKFTMLTDNVNYIEAVKILAQRCGMALPAFSPQDRQESHFRDKCYEINRETANFYYQNLLHGSDKTGLRYLKTFQIRPETVKKYAVGYAPDDWQILHYHLRQKGYSDTEILASGVCMKNQNDKLYDTFRNRILFPVVDFRGNVTGFGAGAVSQAQPPEIYTGNTPVSHQNQTVFSLHIAKKEMISKTLILAENYFNAIAIYQAGFPNVIAVPDILTFYQIKAIRQYAEELIILSSPAMHCGEIQNIRNLCGQAGISLRIAPVQDAFDSAEFLKMHDTETFRNLLGNAGDAVQAVLQNSWEQFDAEQDKNQMIQESIEILSKLPPLEREVYMTETAQKLEIPVEMLQSQLDANYQPKKAYSNKSRSLSKEELSVLPKRNQKKINAEQQLLVYLVRYPEDISHIRKQLSPEKLVTDADRNLYQLICDNNGNLPEYPTELKKILLKYQDFDFNAQTAADCITVLNTTQKQVIL